MKIGTIVQFSKDYLNKLSEKEKENQSRYLLMASYDNNGITFRKLYWCNYGLTLSFHHFNLKSEDFVVVNIKNEELINKLKGEYEKIREVYGE